MLIPVPSWGALQHPSHAGISVSATSCSDADRTRGDGFEVRWGTVRLDIRKRFFSIRAVLRCTAAQEVCVWGVPSLGVPQNCGVVALRDVGRGQGGVGNSEVFFQP